MAEKFVPVLTVVKNQMIADPSTKTMILQIFLLLGLYVFGKSMFERRGYSGLVTGSVMILISASLLGYI